MNQSSGKTKCRADNIYVVTEVLSLSGSQNRVNKLTTFWIDPFLNRYVIKITRQLRNQRSIPRRAANCAISGERARMWCGGMRPGYVRV